MMFGLVRSSLYFVCVRGVGFYGHPLADYHEMN